jgi:hypothetical protein
MISQWGASVGTPWRRWPNHTEVNRIDLQRRPLI